MASLPDFYEWYKGVHIDCLSPDHQLPMPIWLESAHKANKEQKDGAAPSEKVLLLYSTPHPEYAQFLERDGQAPRETLNDWMS